jgi:parvulin-like peptidyl-prolyl isomerase
MRGENVRRTAIVALIVCGPALAARAAPGPNDAVFVRLVGEDGKPAKVPLFSGSDVAVAKAGSEYVTVDDLAVALAKAHEEATSEAAPARKDALAILGRLVDARLVAGEARAMGIGELPEFRKAVAEYEAIALREALQAKATRGVRGDALLVEREYQRSVKEWKARSLLFQKEEDAAKLLSDVAAGATFDVAAEAALKAGKATGGSPAEFYPRDRLLPQVVTALLATEKGRVTDAVRVPGGFAVLHVEEERYPNNPKLRAKAEADATRAAKEVAVRKYYAKLLARYVKTDDKLLAQLDYEAAQPGLEALRKDRRVLSRISGGKDVTVADLTRALEQRFFHGTEGAIRKKEVNPRKAAALDAIISEQIVAIEARRQKLDQTRSYRRAVERFQESLLFSGFVERVVAPAVKVKDADLRAYFEAHRKEYAPSAFYRLESVAYADVRRAQAALGKLRSGTDLNWLRANSDDLLPPGDGVLQFAGTTVASSTMPPALRSVLADARKGDLRLYAPDETHAYAIQVLEVSTPEAPTFDEVKDRVRQQLVEERMSAELLDVVTKLRQARPVKIYLTSVGA